jgi:hypothetical protein
MGDVLLIFWGEKLKREEGMTFSEQGRDFHGDSFYNSPTVLGSCPIYRAILKFEFGC